MFKIRNKPLICENYIIFQKNLFPQNFNRSMFSCITNVHYLAHQSNVIYQKPTTSHSNFDVHICTAKPSLRLTLSKCSFLISVFLITIIYVIFFAVICISELHRSRMEKTRAFYVVSSSRNLNSKNRNLLECTNAMSGLRQEPQR